MASSRGISSGIGAGFKQSRKGSVSDGEKRSLRGHRRSIEWRNLRDDVLNMRRNIDVDAENSSTEDEAQEEKQDRKMTQAAEDSKASKSLLRI